MPTIKQVKKTIQERTEVYRTQFLELSVHQIDSLKSPSGRMSAKAWDNARLEVLNKERKQERIDKLKLLLPSISDIDIAKIELSNEANDGTGLIIKEKEIAIKEEVK